MPPEALSETFYARTEKGSHYMLGEAIYLGVYWQVLTSYFAVDSIQGSLLYVGNLQQLFSMSWAQR
jgi:hypothetical protein